MKKNQPAKPAQPSAPKPPTPAELLFRIGTEKAREAAARELFKERGDGVQSTLPKIGEPISLALAGFAGELRLGDREALNVLAKQVYELRQSFQKLLFSKLDKYELLLLLESISLAEVVCAQNGQPTDLIPDELESRWLRAANQLQLGEVELPV